MTGPALPRETPASPGESEEKRREAHLWDPTAPPDPEVTALEAKLAAFRPAPLLDLGALPTRIARSRTRALTAGVVGLVAAAAALVGLWVGGPFGPSAIGTGSGTVVSISPENDASSSPVSTLPPGGPAFGWRTLSCSPSDGAPCATSGSLRPGGSLETGEGARVRLDVADIGHLDIDPGSKLRLVESGPSEHRLALVRGRITAKVDAPPRLFVIETKRVTAVDLGCAYELAVDEEGNGMLCVTSGAVELDGGARTPVPVVVPKGAECPIDAARGAGTPVWSRLPATARSALAAFDRDPSDLPHLDEGVEALGDRDSLTLIHLLSSAPPDRRARILDRLVAIQPLPVGVTRKAILDGAADALAAYRAVIEQRWYPGPAGKSAWGREPEGGKPAP